MLAHWMVGYLVEACRNCPSLTFCLLARPPHLHLPVIFKLNPLALLISPSLLPHSNSPLASLINSIPSISSPSLQFSQLRCRHLRGNSDLPQTTRLVTNIMPKKGGKKKNKGGAKAPVAAAVDKVADTAKNVVLVLTSNAPAVQYLKNKVQVLKFCAGRVPLAACAPNCNDTEKKELNGNDKVDTTTAQNDAPADVSKSDPVAPAATTTTTTESESKTDAKAEKEAEKKAEEKVEEPVSAVAADKKVAEKVEDVKPIQAEEKGKDLIPSAQSRQFNLIFAAPTLPESTVKDTSLGADIFPSTSEAAAEESATSAAAQSSTDRPKTAESTTAAAAAEPAAVPSENDAAHTKRPYEKPIFSNDEVKPHKIAKTEEEEAAAKAATEKQNLAGAGPASTAAYTTPEPVPETKKVEEKPVEKVAEKQIEQPKVEQRKAEEKPAVTQTPATQPSATQPPVSSKPSASTEKQAASPDAVAAANAAINSKTDKAAAPAAPAVEEAKEIKKPEAVAKRGEEPKTEAPKPEAKESAQEPAKAKEETKSEQATEQQQQPEKKKGGFFGWLKRKFK
ncbi:hypothetical protein VI817_010480 [Penicillium citrinum]|nr:hypothetical protein VI817_010480 [Penicillium citrinum]